jgi:hypothetical protein
MQQNHNYQSGKGLFNLSLDIQKCGHSVKAITFHSDIYCYSSKINAAI